MKNKEKILHQRFVEYGKNSKVWMRRCAFLLPRIAKFEIWKKKGFGSIHEYAGKLAGMSRYQVNDALRILNKIKDKPSLKKVVRERGLQAVRPVVAIATKDTEKFWAAKARELSKNTLETYVKEYRLKYGENDGKSGPRTSGFEMLSMCGNQISDTTGGHIKSPETGTTVMVNMELDSETAKKLLKLKGQGGWNSLIKQLLQIREALINENRPETKEAKSRQIPAKIKKYVLAKTNGNCAFPGCAKLYAILHHTVRFADTNNHYPDQIVPLCKPHEQLAHLGLIENEHLSPDKWEIRQEADAMNPFFATDNLVAKFRHCWKQLCPL